MSPNRSGPSRSPYVLRGACSVCRQKKIKCSGERPICQTCETSGYGGDCSWGSTQVKRIMSRDYVQSLQRRIAFLETKFEQCRNEHGGVLDDYPYASPDISQAEEEEFDFDLCTDNDQDIADRMKAFHLVGQDLQLYGKTSIFRFEQAVPQTRSRFPEITQDASRCYVLMVDGADESKYNPDFDWSRHLPAEVFLDRREHDKLLDLLFKFFTSWSLQIVPALFLRDMSRALLLPASQTPPKTAHYSPMLHNALVALATAFSDEPRLRDHRSRSLFIEKAKSYIDIECHSPNISVVQGLAMIGDYYSSMGNQSLGYLYFGMSGRVSQALGLGIDCSLWVKANTITYDDMQDRNWAYWTTFSQDVCWSLYVGREFCLTLPSDQGVIPIPFVDAEFDQMDWYHPQSGIPPQPGYLSSTFAATCKLLCIGRQIKEVIDMLSTGTRHEAISNMVSGLNLKLNEWKEALPPEVEIKHSNRNTSTPHRLMLELAYWWHFIVLHRPFYRRDRPDSPPENGIDHVKQCDRAARNIMELLDTWSSLYSLRYVPIGIFVQVIFGAGTVFVYSAVQAASGSRMAKMGFQNSLDQADQCIKYLHEAGRSFQCAKHIAGILAKLLQKEIGELSKIVDKTGITSGLLVAPDPAIDLHNLSGHPQVPQVEASSSQHSQPQALDPSIHVWQLNPMAPMGSAVAGQWPFSKHMTYAQNDITASPPPGSVFGMGLGMRGGETLSTRPFSHDQFYGTHWQFGSQFGTLGNEAPREAPRLTAEDFARMTQTLNHLYPYTNDMDLEGQIREMI